MQKIVLVVEVIVLFTSNQGNRGNGRIISRSLQYSVTPVSRVSTNESDLCSHSSCGS